MVLTFAGALWQALLRVFEQKSSAVLTALCCCGTLNTAEPLLPVSSRSSQHGLVLFPPAQQCFSSIIYV